MNKFLISLSNVTALTFVLAQDTSFAKEHTSSSTVSTSGYQIVLVDSRWPTKPFIVDVPSTNVEGIETLESYIADGIQYDDNGNIVIGIVIGKVEKTLSSSTHAWNFQLDPNTVTFYDRAIELCDANFQHVEDNLDQWMTDVKMFCPWGTNQLIKSITKI